VPDRKRERTHSRAFHGRIGDGTSRSARERPRHRPAPACLLPVRSAQGHPRSPTPPHSVRAHFPEPARWEPSRHRREHRSAPSTSRTTTRARQQSRRVSTILQAECARGKEARSRRQTLGPAGRKKTTTQKANGGPGLLRTRRCFFRRAFFSSWTAAPAAWRSRRDTPATAAACARARSTRRRRACSRTRTRVRRALPSAPLPDPPCCVPAGAPA
jgi:hypothetical protein